MGGRVSGKEGGSEIQSEGRKEEAGREGGREIVRFKVVLTFHEVEGGRGRAGVGEREGLWR